MRVLMFILCLSFVGGTALAEELGPFDRGVSLLQEKNASEAVAAFKEALESRPDDPTILTNLGIASFVAGQKGWAMAFLRQALSQGSNHPETRRAFQFVSSQLEVKELPHEVELWEVFREKVLLGISLTHLLATFALILLLAGLVFIRFLARRQRALKDEGPLPGFGAMHGATVLVLLISLALLWAKWADETQVRATVVADKVPVLTAPSAEAPPLFDLFAGLEVIVQREQNGWYQVQYPGGSVGWIARENVHITQSAQYVR